MRRLRAEIEVHACKGAARQALGARSRARRDAGAVRPCAQDHAHPTPDRRTSIRNHQSVDGRDPLQAAHPRKGQRGDEPSRSRLQSEADDRHPRGAAAHPGDEGRLSPSPYENINRQQTQPRFLRSRIGSRRLFARPRRTADLQESLRVGPVSTPKLSFKLRARSKPERDIVTVQTLT